MVRRLLASVGGAWAALYAFLTLEAGLPPTTAAVASAVVGVVGVVAVLYLARFLIRWMRSG